MSPQDISSISVPEPFILSQAQGGPPLDYNYEAHLPSEQDRKEQGKSTWWV